MKEIVVFHNAQTLTQSICDDVVTCAFLLLCIWFSTSQGGGWWTFFTCGLFLVLLAAKLPAVGRIKLRSKREAIEWAQSLPDDRDA